MKKKPLVLFLVGPTASGKSEVAIELAALVKAEIISADSMQVYRGMDILSAKPTKEQRKKIPHYLIDILELSEEYSVAIFRNHTLKLIKEIHNRKKTPLIVGGTGLYIRMLIKGLFIDKGKNDQLRERLYKEADRKGTECLYERLRKIDKSTAAKIHPKDLRRIVRAIEAYEVNRSPLSALKKKVVGLDKNYQLKMFGIRRPRDELYERIEKRVEKMFEAGIVTEVKKLEKLSSSLTARQALGLKQIKSYLHGNSTLEEAKETLKRDTRRFAKRQLTWFRRDKNIVWIDVKHKKKTASEISRKILAYLKKPS